MARILVVDDEVTMVQMVTELLRREGHEVFPFNNGNAAHDALEEQQPELVITDLNLEKSRVQGLDIVKKARSLSPPAEVIVITAFGSVGTAVEAMRQGAYDYLEKPFKLDDFKLCAQRALSYTKAVAENHFLKKQLSEKYQFNQIIGTSAPMQQVFRMIERVADTDSTVLILGESGTGKELVARALHFNSRRRFAPFIPINCAALPENLLESELFGHRKGAFTGALVDKKGLFQEADGGTLFLDEIGTMPAMLQSRLLRVLQDREVRRVGENTPLYVNVRVLAATNEPLEQRIRDGSFREDLYYRLNVIPISLPPLRDRRDDIPLLVGNFLKNKVHIRSGQPFQIARAAIEAMNAHEWPGNVRELENVIERACALSENPLIRAADLPPVIQAHAAKEVHVPAAGSTTTADPAAPAPSSARRKSTGDTVFALPVQPGAKPVMPAGAGGATTGAPNPSTGPGTGAPLDSLKDFLREQEMAYLNRALAMANGDKEKAAGILGISLATLYRKLAEEGAGVKTP
ncbi:MAG TPA: sigma-54 dependent transcriptional regulator [Verrucomicrobiae bacterium]|nr:sigma-54 dependent transcriptional regulator [Verrucomicrobiae bacterium]